jgi:hypothetical protein
LPKCDTSARKGLSVAPLGPQFVEESADVRPSRLRASLMEKRNEDRFGSVSLSRKLLLRLRTKF